MSNMRQRMRDLYDRMAVMGIAGVIVAGVILLFLIAILVIAIVILVQTDELEDIKSKGKCTDYNPCTKDQYVDGYCIDPAPRHPRGHNCSNWECLAEDGEGYCDYNPFTMKTECVGDCAGSCDFSPMECPDVQFTNDAPTPVVNCSNRVCVYTLDFEDTFINSLVNCDSNNPNEYDCCLKYINSTSGNQYSDNKCLKSVPVCTPVNDSNPQTTYYLEQCQFYFGCACRGPLLII